MSSIDRKINQFLERKDKEVPGMDKPIDHLIEDLEAEERLSRVYY